MKSFDTQVVLKGINLDIYENEFVTLLGPSGCGKTTLLRILGGFLDADEGKVIRKEMQYELKRIQQEVGITFIFVTHDQEEALTMSDKIVVMQKGEILQIGTPQEIYNEPTNRFVANFIGESNIISGRMIEDYKVRFDDITFDCVDHGFKENELVDVDPSGGY